ncbi:hypothetical protein EOD39_13985 [Acipenser ruthenus]|uniref:Uncharacterized protein n=1 Tax=Acipenser ruthenus TaxID=7906 RepID=A0A444UHB1_ACIRT|nr:hypothetical protein EOD39_13985 [Acipenser ruthenus]
MEGSYWGEDDRAKKRRAEKKLQEEFQLLTEEVGAARRRLREEAGRLAAELKQRREPAGTGMRTPTRGSPSDEGPPTLGGLIPNSPWSVAAMQQEIQQLMDDQRPAEGGRPAETPLYASLGMLHLTQNSTHYAGHPLRSACGE